MKMCFSNVAIQKFALLEPRKVSRLWAGNNIRQNQLTSVSARNRAGMPSRYRLLAILAGIDLLVHVSASSCDFISSPMSFLRGFRRYGRAVNECCGDISPIDETLTARVCPSRTADCRFIDSQIRFGHVRCAWPRTGRYRLGPQGR
jgi:hypothetical protein